MKITVDDILLIKPGRTKVFFLKSPNECHSVVSLVSYVKKMRKPQNVANYATTTDWEALAVSVTAKGMD